MDIIKAMQEYYNRRSSVYDSSMKYDNPEEVKNLTPVINLIKEYLKDKNVLEIACGPGFWTYWVSEKAASITATDYNQSVIDIAKQKEFDFAKVNFQSADAYLLDNINGEFDGALAVDWLAHVPLSRMESFLRNYHSKLSKGARVVFCDQIPGSHSLTGIYDDEGNHIQERILPDNSRYRVIKNFFSNDELKEIFADYADNPKIFTFPECRRKILCYIYQNNILV